jgi:single-stranded DNA-binding protein
MLLSFTINATNNYIFIGGKAIMAKEKEKKPLVQTKGAFKAIGKVTRIDKDGAFREGVADKGKKKGETYRSLRFGVKTSETNEVTVNMFDYEPEEVFLWNSDLAKKEKDKGGKYKGLKVPFDEWVDNEEKLKEEGHSVLQARTGFSYGEDGKLQTRGLPKFVASEEIFENLDNGDSVVIEGDIRYSEYENQQGQMVQKKDLSIEKCYKIKDIDFEDAKFEEVTYFEQELIYIDAEPDKANKKVFLTGRTIDYKKNWNDSQFVIDYSDGEGGDDKDMVTLATGVLKKMKFGDKIKVFGEVLNRAVVVEVEDESDESEEDKLLASLGGKTKPKHAQKWTNTNYISEMRIEGVEAWDKKFYAEEDFVKDELVEDEKDESEDLGGKNKKKGTNPFESDIDADDIGDDDLPF